MLDFFISDVGVLSTLDVFKESDKLSMPGNTNARIKNGKNILTNYFLKSPYNVGSILLRICEVPQKQV